jgi:hypothetical protein
MAGYSGTPLFRKLGMRPGMRVRLVNPPGHYAELVAPLPEGVTLSAKLRTDVELCHLFVKKAGELRRRLPELMKMIRQDGCIWVSWPKKASGVPTDITEDTIRTVALPLGLVDIKVCAVDETWSGLKLVIRKENRR